MTSVTVATSPKKKSKVQKLVLCTASVRYVVIKKVCRELGFRFSDDENGDWDLFWSDVGLQQDRVQKLKSWQRINHY